MDLHEIKGRGLKKKRRRRVGRGSGSGVGKTCGRGENGQKSRAGSFGNRFFVGGQTPIFRRLPKRGFVSHVAKPAVVNLEDLNRFEDGSTVDMEVLMAAGLVQRKDKKVKVLGRGKLEKKLTVRVSCFSTGAAESIGVAGGKAEKV